MPKHMTVVGMTYRPRPHIGTPDDRLEATSEERRNGYQKHTSSKHMYGLLSNNKVHEMTELLRR